MAHRLLEVWLLAGALAVVAQAQVSHIAAFGSVGGSHGLGYSRPNYQVGVAFAGHISDRFVLGSEASYATQNKFVVGNGGTVHFDTYLRSYFGSGGTRPFVSAGVKVRHYWNSQWSKTPIYPRLGAGLNFKDTAIIYARYNFTDLTTENRGSGPDFGVEYYLPVAKSWGLRFGETAGILRFNSGTPERRTGFSFATSLGVYFISAASGSPAIR